MNSICLQLQKMEWYAFKQSKNRSGWPSLQVNKSDVEEYSWEMIQTKKNYIVGIGNRSSFHFSWLVIWLIANIFIDKIYVPNSIFLILRGLHYGRVWLGGVGPWNRNGNEMFGLEGVPFPFWFHGGMGNAPISPKPNLHSPLVFKFHAEFDSNSVMNQTYQRIWSFYFSFQSIPIPISIKNQTRPIILMKKKQDNSLCHNCKIWCGMNKI